MKRLWLFSLMFLLLSCFQEDLTDPVSSTSSNNPVQLSSRVDRALATPNETIRFEIVLNMDPNLNLIPPQIGDQIQKFRIINEGIEGPVRKEGRNMVTRWYLLRADLVGSYVLPAVKIEAEIPQGPLQLIAPKIFVEIKPVEGGAETKEGEEGLRDIKPIVKTKIPLTKVLLWVGLGVLLLLGLGALLWWAKRWSQKSETQPGIPADQWALEHLESLRREFGETWDLSNLELRKKFYFSLSEIFRNYLEKRFSIPAIDLTKEEILPHLKKQQDLTHQSREWAQQFLNQTDFVKFTDLIPPKEDPKKCHFLAQEFVLKTKPQPAIEVLEGSQ